MRVALLLLIGCDLYPECTTLVEGCAEICCTPYSDACVVLAGDEYVEECASEHCAEVAIVAAVVCEP